MSYLLPVFMDEIEDLHNKYMFLPLKKLGPFQRGTYCGTFR